MTTKKYTVTIVDDHPAIALALRGVLAGSEFVVRDYVDNGTDAITLIKNNPPDYVILDIGLPCMDGLTVMQRLNALKITTNYLIYTSYGNNADIVRRCIRAGAKGVVDKTQSVEDVLAALNVMKKGVTYFPDQIVSVFSHNRNEAFRSLTDREFTVLRKLISGKSGREIAKELLLSDKTVSTYKSRLLKKLNVKTILDLKRISVGTGINELEGVIDLEELEAKSANVTKPAKSRHRL